MLSSRIVAQLVYARSTHFPFICMILGVRCSSLEIGFREESGRPDVEMSYYYVWKHVLFIFPLISVLWLIIQRCSINPQNFPFIASMARLDSESDPRYKEVLRTQVVKVITRLFKLELMMMADDCVCHGKCQRHTTSSVHVNDNWVGIYPVPHNSMLHIAIGRCHRDKRYSAYRNYHLAPTLIFNRRNSLNLNSADPFITHHSGRYSNYSCGDLRKHDLLALT